MQCVMKCKQSVNGTAVGNLEHAVESFGKTIIYNASMWICLTTGICIWASLHGTSLLLQRIIMSSDVS